jgi:hypothetical protein
LARNILFYRDPVKTFYVGCPLSLAVCPDLVREVFPTAKIIVCVRDPTQTVPSLINLLSTALTMPFSDVKPRATNYFDVVSRGIYTRLSEWESDPKTTYWMDFNDWKADSVAEVERIWKWLGVDYAEGASEVAKRKSESHKNPPECFEVVPKQKI